MAELSLTGILIAAMPTKSGTSQRGSAWMKRDYVIKIPGQYDRHFIFTVFGEDRLKEFNLRKDEEITVFFEIDAHEYQGKWYNSCMAYRVQRFGEQTQAPAQQQPQQPTQQAEQLRQSDTADNGSGEEQDDLPF